MKDHVVNRVVQNDLCCSCGVCSGACPANALPMKIQTNGDLTPEIVQDRCETKRNCRYCLDICPMLSGIHDPRDMNQRLFSSNSERKNSFHEDIGWYRRVFVGARRDPSLRRISASGGLATWCLERLLLGGAVTRVAVVRLASNRDCGMFEFRAATTVEELRRAAGSFYQPIEISGILREVTADRKQVWAIVGVPCLCAAIRNLRHLRKQIRFVFGLACGMYQNIFYTELLLGESGVAIDDVEVIEYRQRAEQDGPWNYLFRATTQAGVGRSIAYKGLPHNLGKHAYFRLNACNYCKDVFAEAADACFMDAWLPEYRTEMDGTSIVVIRDHEVDAVFGSFEAHDEIETEELSPEQVVGSQLTHVRRKRELIYMRTGQAAPQEYGFPQASWIEYADWLLQRYTQRRSKHAWLRYGRRWGLFGFWAAVLDVLVLRGMLEWTLRGARLPRRVLRRLSKMASR